MYEVKFKESHLYVEGLEEFHDETDYGEPQCWIELPNGRSIEVTHEEYGLEVPYFSLRLHSSEEEFDNTSKDVLETLTVDSIEEVNKFAIPTMLRADEAIKL